MAAPDVAAPAIASDGEMPALRTQTSRTYREPDGRNRTVVSSAPVNYRDGHGNWQKIDTTLVKSADGTFAPAASGTPVVLPSSLSDAVTVGAPGQAVSFQLAGASGVGAARGSTVSYPQVLPGVTATEAATASGVKEDLSLASPAATSSFIFHVTVPAGDSLTAGPNGSAAVITATGTTVGVVTAPIVSDAHGVSSTTATSMRRLDASTLQVSVDPAWLAAPGRSFPVVVDPNYDDELSTSAAQIENGSQVNVNYGSATQQCVGNDPSHSNATARLLLSFGDLGADMPRDARIDSAYVDLNAASVSTATTVNVVPLSRAFTASQATWNIAATGTNWTTAGGDFGTGSSTSQSIAAAYSDYYANVDAAWLRPWIETGHQYGLALKATNEGSAGLVCFNNSQDPVSLDMFWTQRQGVASNQQYFTHQIDGHESISVNLADGNLVDKSTEMSDSAPGVPVLLARTWNTMTAQRPRANGMGWYQTPADTGADQGDSVAGYVGLIPGQFYSSSALTGSDTYDSYEPANINAPTNGQYTSPAATNATASASGDITATGTTLKITDNASQATENLTNINGIMQLTNITSRTGLSEAVNYSTTSSAESTHELGNVTDTAGRVFTYAYGTGSAANSGYVTGITGPTVNGSPLSTGYTYQTATGDGGQTWSELATATDTGGGITHYGYDSSDRITKITSPKGNIVTISYTAANQVASVTYITNVSAMTGDTYNFVYTQPTVTGGNGTTVVRDPLYNSATSTTAHTTTYTWNPDDEITLVTDALGRHRADTFSSNGDGLTETDGLSTGLGTGGGNTGTNVYDSNNNLHTAQGAALSGGSAAMTTQNHTMTSGPAGYQYLMNSSQDAQTNMTSYAYDTMGLENQTTLPASMGSTSTKYQGDSGVTCGAKAGEVCSSTDADGHTTSTSYDSQGDLTTVTPPAPLPASTITPDALGRPVASVDGNANTTHYVYNGLGEVSATELGGTTTCTTSNISAGTCAAATYDADGRQLSLADATGTTTYSYDLTGAQTGESEPGYYASSIGYDAAGNVTSFTDDGGTVTYSYDAANTLTDVAEPGGNCVKTGTTLYSITDAIPAAAKCTALAHDGNAAVTALEYPGGQLISYTRDNDGRPLTITAKRSSTGATFFSQTLDYQTSAAPSTDTGLLQSDTDTDTGSTVYGYDALNRLVSAKTGSAAAAIWTVDAQGNRTSYTPSGGTKVNYAYNPAGQLCETGTTTITTSYAGACTAGSPSGSNTRYTYDSDGNQTGGALPAGATTLAYNSASQTASTTTGGTTTPYTYASTSQTQRHTAGGLGYASGLVAQNGQPSRIVSGSTTNYITRLPDGTPISLRSQAGTSATSYYYTLDYQGSARRLDAAAATSDAGTYSYDPYGQTLTNTSSSAVALNPVNYTGGTRDTTGLTKLGTRYYNPALGRFTQLDGSGKSPGYGYAAGDPVNQSDPTGELPSPHAIEAAIEAAASIAALFFPANFFPRLAIAAIESIASTAYDCIFGCDHGFVYTLVKNAAVSLFNVLPFTALDKAFEGLFGLVGEARADAVNSLAEYLAGYAESYLG